METWKDIPGFEGRYQGSDHGRVKGRSRMLKVQTNLKGYQYIALHKDGKISVLTIHRMVCLIFIPNPLGLPEINHKDGNKCNNAPENLEWVNKRENQAHFQNREHLGTCLHRKRNKYQARIWIGKRSHSLGYHATAEEAARAYRQALQDNGLQNRYADRP